jgi:hypothetical protein
MIGQAKTMGNGMLRACKQPLVGRNDTKSGCVGDYITKDLRPISLTATLSKTCERFVADWLVELIGEKIDKRQFGSLKTPQQHMHY